MVLCAGPATRSGFLLCLPVVVILDHLLPTTRSGLRESVRWSHLICKHLNTKSEGHWSR